MSDTRMFEQLVMEKAQLQQQVRNLGNLLVAVCLISGEENKKGALVYRIPKAKMKTGHDLEVKSLKSGSVVLALTKQEKDDG